MREFNAQNTRLQLMTSIDRMGELRLKKPLHSNDVFERHGQIPNDAF